MKNLALLLIVGLMGQAAYAVRVVESDAIDRGDEKIFSCQFAGAPCAPNDYTLRKALFTKWANEYKQTECDASVEEVKNQLDKVESKLDFKDGFELSSYTSTSNYTLPNTSGDLVKSATAAGFRLTTCSVKIKSRNQFIYFDRESRRYFASDYFWFSENNFEQRGIPAVCLEKLKEAKTDSFKLFPHITTGGSVVAGYCGVRYFNINVQETK